MFQSQHCSYCLVHVFLYFNLPELFYLNKILLASVNMCCKLLGAHGNICIVPSLENGTIEGEEDLPVLQQSHEMIF